MGVALALTLLAGACAGPGTTAASLPPPGSPAATPEVAAAQVLPASPPTRITIPAIGVDSGLIELGLQPDRTLEVPADGTVAGWYGGAPTPGELGPAVIAAHVDWNGERGVFFDLHELARGDEITVERADGRAAVFAVLAVERYPKDRFPSAAVYGDLDHAGVRLITCGGEFDDEARSYRDNVVVFAGLVRSA